MAPLAESSKNVVTWAAKDFAREVCLHMAHDNPQRYVVIMAKRLRVGRIFLDHLRNDRRATAAVPFRPELGRAPQRRCR